MSLKPGTLRRENAAASLGAELKGVSRHHFSGSCLSTFFFRSQLFSRSSPSSSDGVSMLREPNYSEKKFCLGC